MFEKYSVLIKEINHKYGYTEDCDGELISFRENKDSHSICLGNNALIILKQTRNAQRILIKTTLFNKINIALFELYPSAKFINMKSDPLYTKIETQLEDDVTDLLFPFIEKAIQDFQPSKTFACCSRYIQCSDAKKCLHPQQIYAKQCWYRDNLENDKIFYGKNKNI